MSDIRLSVGTLFYVSPAVPATYDETGFEALVWTEVGEVENLGEFGGTAQITNFVPLATGIVKKRKGSIDYGTAAVSIGRLAGDAGQALLKDGFDGSAKYDVHSFKVVNSDNETAYFTGLVGSFVTRTNDANTVTAVSSNIELDNRVLSDVYDFFSLTYAAGANGSIIGDTQQSVPEGGDGTPVFANAAAGFVFDKWSDTVSDNPRQDLNVTGDISVTAAFIPV